MTRTKAHEKTV